jgi:hypothetical protein
MSITSVKNDSITAESFASAQQTKPPTISGYSVDGVDDTALLPEGGQTVLVNGTGFQRGAVITFDGSAIAVVSFISSSQLSFTSPAKSAGTYTIYVVNADGGTAIYLPGVIYSTVPTWSTSAGSLGNYYETTNISDTVVATGDDPITYSLYSGSLPTGSTLYANGVITGTAPVDSGSTTYSFTIEAIDNELQSSTRSFSLTINTDVVSWVNPTNGESIELDGTLYSTTLSATSAAGYAIASYSANALPDGLTLDNGVISGTPEITESFTTLLTATAATTGRSQTNIITWTITIGDEYWDYVTTLLSCQTPNPLPFNDDASANNFAVSIAGDTKPNNFNPYTLGYYSFNFTAKTQYVSIPATTALTTFTGDFTFEAWVYLPDTSISRWGLWDSRNTGGVAQAMVLTIDPLASAVTGQGRMKYYNGTNYYSTGIVYYNCWTHIAYVRSGSTLTFYINGVASGTATVSGTQTGTATSNPVWIGSKDNGGATYGTTGYVSNFRIVNGTAVYTDNFTPSTEPLTAITDTVLLTAQSNRFIDNSTNNYTLTSGGAIISGFDPYLPNSSYSTYGSTYFDGTGDWLTVPYGEAFSTGSTFTIEAWVYPTVLNATNNEIFNITNSTVTNFGGLIFYVNGSGVAYFESRPGNGGTNVSISGGTVPVNRWTHMAVSVSSNTAKLFVNGVQVGSGTITALNGTQAHVAIGAFTNGFTAYPWTGYISNLRVVKGTAVYTTDFTPPTSPLTAISGTSLLTCQSNQSANNNVFVDNSTNNFLITRNGNTTQGTFSPYGENWSNYFDGTGDYLSLPSNAAFAFGTGDFTVECWVYATATPSDVGIFESRTNGIGTTVDGFTLTAFSASVIRIYSDGILISSSGTSYINTWCHVAVVRASGVWALYINGVSQGTNSAVRNMTNTDAVIGAGRYNSNSTPSAYFPGYISNFRILKGTAVYTANFTPSTTPLQAIAGTSLLTCQSPSLVDDSPNNFTITRNGDVSVQKFGPFAATTLPTPYYSAYFDGTGDSLTTPANAVFGFGTGDFTVEFWINFSSTANRQDLVWWGTSSSDRGGLLWNITAGNLTYYISPTVANAINYAWTPQAGTWYHIALVRNSGSTKLYINGVQGGSTYSDSKNYSTSNLVTVAQDSGAASSYFNGYMSNLRIVKGTAVYTTNFTPPTAPLTAISGTSLLTCQSNTFIDNSTNNFAITVNGNSQPTYVNPFTVTYSTAQSYTPAVYGGSMYFDGTGDYLDLPNNPVFSQVGSWTLELWVYPTVATNNYVYSQATTNFLQINITGTNYVAIDRSGVGNLITSTNPILLNAWTHIALVSDGTNMKLFINGTQSGSTAAVGTQASSATTTRIGAYQPTGSLAYQGYISDLRLVKGTALYTSNFVPQNQPLTPVTNTTLLANGTSAGIYDSSENNDFETVGNASISTSVVKYGNTSMRFDGTGDYLAVPSSQNFAFGTGNFTIECWVYYAAITNSGIFQIGATLFPGVNGIGAGVGTSSDWLLYYGNGSQTGGGSLTSGTWYHIAVVRNSGTTKMYVNGTQIISIADTTNYTGTVLGVAGIYSTSYLMNGYISDLRITKGIARYTANFTPPNSALQTK